MTTNVILNNGVQMPALGFGVFQAPPDVTAQAADAAHGVLTQAWSPIGGITSYRGTGTRPSTTRSSPRSPPPMARPPRR